MKMQVRHALLSVFAAVDDHAVAGFIYPQLFEMPLRVGQMMNEGFHARLRRDRMDSLQAFENPIEEGLLKALEDEAFDLWLAGKKIFRKIS